MYHSRVIKASCCQTRDISSSLVLTLCQQPSPVDEIANGHLGIQPGSQRQLNMMLAMFLPCVLLTVETSMFLLCYLKGLSGLETDLL